MKYPSNLSPNILKAYSEPSTDQCPPTVRQSIRISFNDSKTVDTLQELCLLNIAHTWEQNPRDISLGTAENRNYFLQELNAGRDLLTVTQFIKDDLFWEGQYKAAYGPRYVATPPGKWLQIFMEKNLQEWLERLKPCDYEEELVLERLELYAPYVDQLTVHNFQPPPKQEIHHIPLGLVLQTLTELRCIDLSVNVKDAGDDFSGVCNLSDKDINTLALGLESCDILEFRLAGTKLSPTMAKRLGCSLERCRNLKLLHLPSCNLCDNGVISFLMGLSPDSLLAIEDLNLSNNFISSTGAFQLAIVLARRSVKQLNLRLNPIKSEGACLLFGKLFSLQRLESVNFSACSLDSSVGIMLCKMLKDCKSLQTLSLSVNSFGDQLGWSLLERLQETTSIIEFDIRNTNLSATITMQIDGLINRNLIKYLEESGSL